MSAADRERETAALRQHQLYNIESAVVTERPYELGFIDGYSIGRSAAERDVSRETSDLAAILAVYSRAGRIARAGIAQAWPALAEALDSAELAR